MKKKNVKNNKQQKVIKTNKELKEKCYIGYNGRLIINIVIMLLLGLISSLLLNNVLKIENKQQIKYKELGNLDYKVHLKENDFYETEYLNGDMEYISSLIDNVDIDMVYELKTSEEAETSYKIIGKLLIYNEAGNNTLYEKDYVIQKEQLCKEKIEENIKIDYDYYNDIANNFKNVYGVDAESKLEINVIIKKSISEIDAGISEMSLTIPLTQKTIEIQLDNKTINEDSFLEKEKELTSSNIICIVLLTVFITLLLIVIIKTIRLILLLRPKETKYDKYLKKLLREYDRLIIETQTEPNLEGKKIIKIKKFEELLDVRDNLKKPIIYYSIVKHHKSYFFVEETDNCYLYILKSIDIEEKHEKK